MKVFILDDIRNDVDAYYGANLSLEHLADDTITLVRTFDEGVALIASADRFDLWVLDHDLGCYAPDSKEQNGYDFLMYSVYAVPDKIPDQLVSCSSNPVGRERIVELFKNWKRFNFGERR